MGDWGANPLYGWEQGPNDPWRNYGWVPAADGFFPAPPGMAWYEIPAAAAPAPAAQGGMQWAWGGCPGYPGVQYPQMQYQQMGEVNNGGRPGINLPNAGGGIGLEPGMNYLFHDEHCKVFVITSPRPPWQAVAATPNLPYQSFWVPCNTTVKSLMQQLGANNADAAKNTISECTPSGNGKWYKGITIKGDDKDTMKKTIAEMGWRNNRNGLDEDVVWLYITKD